ncbi:MAG: hypothetical protein J6W00_04455 [Lentisphaeria bacterium]|nr:hypothetical protein [Lentisphaeria bacterium]
MSNWKNFESSSADYLNRSFGSYAQFINRGSSDSTTSDIEVTTKNGRFFYIEAKDCPAQCGQFVLFPNFETRTFEYSSRNVTEKNDFAISIINHMNRFFDEFKNTGTTGKEISFANCSMIFANWIIQAYKSKGVLFMITNNNTILPIDNIASCFDITAKYRTKRSGSREIGTRNISVVSQYIRKHYSITKIFSEKGKLFVTSKQNLHEERFFISETEYMISQRENQYEIRKLSNTFNANVIFSITLKADYCGLSNSEFISFLLK